MCDQVFILVMADQPLCLPHNVQMKSEIYFPCKLLLSQRIQVLMLLPQVTGINKNSDLECSVFANRGSSFLFTVCIGVAGALTCEHAQWPEKNILCPDLPVSPLPS